MCVCVDAGPTRAALQEMLANLSSDGGELVGGKVTVHSDAGRFA